MVISLYVSEIPKNITKEDLNQLFKTLEGFKEVRMKISNNERRKIAFVDYESESEAKFAQQTLQGFKFSSEDKGIHIKFSENNKNGEKIDKRDANASNTSPILIGKKRRIPLEENFKKSNISFRNDENFNNIRDKVQSQPFNPVNNLKNTPNGNNNIIELLNVIANAQNNSHNALNNQLNVINNNEQGVSNISINPSLEFLSLLNNIQSLSTPNHISNQVNTNYQQPIEESTHNKDNLKFNSFSNEYKNRFNIKNSSSSLNQNFNKKIMKYDEKFKKLISLPKNATNIVYVEGLPLDTTEREIAHVFRPFKGFISVRLINRDKNGEKSLICFADFEELLDASICINTLQGYRFDKNSLVGLHFSYGVNKYKK